MPSFHDMLQCEHCDTFYAPTHTVTGRIEPHCRPIERWTPAAEFQAKSRLNREPVQTSYLDFSEIEQRIRRAQILDIEV